MSEAKTKVTREILCEEARFILANVMAEARYGRQNRYDDIRRVCEGTLTIPFSDYIQFLDAAGYLRHDRGTEALEITKDGEGIVNGGNLTELTERAVAHFKSARKRKDDTPERAPASERPVERPMSPTERSERPSDRNTLPSERPVERGERAVERGERAVERSERAVERSERGERAVERGERAVERGERGERAVAERFQVSASRSRGSGVVGGEIQTPSGSAMDSRYERLQALGSGGIGTVWRARQVALSREVALKEVSELFSDFSEEHRAEITRRFTEVVRAAAQLAHPNIVPIHEASLERDNPYVVTELAPNGSCRRLINDAEEIPVELALKYLLQTLHALDAAHAIGVYHRGLKPENLLIDAYGNVKVSDFGFSRIVERETAARQVYVGMGNIAYMAPELYHEPLAAGSQTDIYALGIIFYELLTRRLPGRRSPMPSQINASLPQGIDDIFDRMTRDSRAERYSSVPDILSDINRLEGLGELLDHQTQVLVAENPLDQIKFRESVAGESSVTTSASDPFLGDGKPKSSSSTYRPYSFQQRQKR